jgi:phosphatidyl-myo-inositol alpha-mannosyltransferase
VRIAFVYDDSLDRPDGVTQYVLTLGEWLTNQGHDVFYIVGETKRTDLKNVYSVSRNKTWKFNGNRIAVPYGASNKLLKKVLDEIQPDVLHVQAPYHPLLAGRTMKIGRKMFGTDLKIVLTFHIMPYGLISKLGTRLLGLVSRSSMKLVDQPLAVSAPAQKFSQEVYGLKNVKVMPNTVDLSKYQQESELSPEVLTKLENYMFDSSCRAEQQSGNGVVIATSEPQPRQSGVEPVKIIFVGRADTRKGAEWLVNALKQIQHQKLGNFRAVFAGRWSPEEISKFKQLAEKPITSASLRPLGDEALAKAATPYPLPSYFDFIGEVTESDKRALLKSADIAVYPSTGGESFGIVLIEAMAANHPVTLGCNNPGYASVLADTPEALFSADKKTTGSDSVVNSDELVNILVKYINNPELRISVARKQNTAVEQFDLSVVGPKLLKVYKESC